MTSASSFFKKLGRDIQKEFTPAAESIDHLFNDLPSHATKDLAGYYFPKAVDELASPFVQPYEFGLIDSPYQLPAIGPAYFFIEFFVVLYSR